MLKCTTAFVGHEVIGHVHRQTILFPTLQSSMHDGAVFVLCKAIQLPICGGTKHVL